MTEFEIALKTWMLDNGYIGEDWAFKVESRAIIWNSDFAEITTKASKPRYRKAYHYSFKFNFVQNQVHTDTMQVALY